MKKQVFYLSLIIGFVAIGCSDKNKPTKKTISKIDSSNIKKEVQLKKNLAPSVEINEMSDSEIKLGVGCTTNFYKGESINPILSQGGSLDDKGWLTILKLNGKIETFYTQENPSESEGENGYTMKLENGNYIIEVTAKVGETNIESDSSESFGKIKITPKSDDYSRTEIQFRGETAC